MRFPRLAYGLAFGLVTAGLAGCGDDTGTARGGAGGAGGSGGAGGMAGAGGSGGSGGAGGMAGAGGSGGSGGTAGAGGSGGSGGVGGTGGRGGMGGSGGAGGMGGAGGTGGSAGAPGVQCGQNMTCTPDQTCCVTAMLPPSFSCMMGDCPPGQGSFRCDGPEDCRGGPCCGTFTGVGGGSASSQCANGTDCPQGQQVICHNHNDCPASAMHCCVPMGFGSGFCSMNNMFPFTTC